MAEAGSVAPVFRDGGYDATATYDFYHALIHNNKLYFCRQDGTIGHEPQEESDEYWFLSIDGNIVDASTLNGKTESELSVADSAKLGGKGASEYLLKGLIESSHVASNADEVETIISTWITNTESRTVSYYLLNINFLGYVIPNGLYAVVFSKNSNLYASIEGIGIASYNSGVQVKRSMNNGTWSDWSTNATTSDLANYLPKTGGTVGGNGTSRPIALKGLANEAYLQYVSANGTDFGLLGFYGVDNPIFIDANRTKQYQLLHSGNSAKVVQATSAPSDTTAVWVDTANKVIKIYKDGAWTALA